MALLAPVVDGTGAAHLGWLVGIATSAFANTIFVIAIGLAPPLNQRAAAGGQHANVLLFAQLSLMLVGALWVIFGIQVGLGLLERYAVTLAIASAVGTGPIILLFVLTAANQVGLRGIRR